MIDDMIDPTHQFYGPDQQVTEPPSIMVEVTQSQARLIAVPKPIEALAAEFGDKLSDSDLTCLALLVSSGKLRVERDRDTRRLVLCPSDDTEDFVNAVFDVR